ncbi:AAA family ATPase [Winogradskyella undariae]|uniref:AAA family ATPase n=1 Tax=Winogradskyella undariae TaxID=1285465 RepID=UPI00156B688F|nr:AAA family ATPase [Winogradskyella undariae]NRR93140.1 AAA family ATPase [Winogradskyella undariae]
MIYVDRNKVEKPKFFYSKECETKISELTEFYQIPRSKRAQKRFVEYYAPFGIIEALNELFNGKCAYCESKIILDKSNDFLDHFRPRNNAKGFNKDQTDLDHYWWLMYHWNNMYLSCLECKKFKSTWFPVEGKRVMPITNFPEIVTQENNLLIDPCYEEIVEHIGYDFKTGNIIPLDKKGETTIEILKLNRRRLVSGRLSAIKEEFDSWERISNQYRKTKKIIEDRNTNHWVELLNYSSKKEFVGARRAFLNDNLNNNLEIKTAFELAINSKEKPLFKESISFSQVNRPSGELKSFERPTIEDSDFVKKTNPYSKNKELLEIKKLLKNVYIDKIELKNYKCFDSLKIDLSKNTVTDKEPWLVFLGENGVGKSSLIKAVALALMGQNYLNSLNLDASKILKYGKWSGYIKVYGSKKDEFFEITFNKDSKHLTSNIKEPPCYLLGYGSTRLLPKGNLMPESDVEYVKTKNLFDYSISLSDARQWLLEIPSKMFNQVALSLKDLLMLDQDDVIKRSKSKNALYISYAKTKNRIDVDELSDGYKSIFAITVDIINTLSKDNLAFETAEAIVLIDEIGTHLHPRWKMEVVSRLRKTFPKIQFIVTTHEPLCLRGLESNEVLVLKRNDEGKIISLNKLPNPSDFRVDQLLTSEYFGLNSTLDFETEALFKEYYNLLAKENRTDEEQNRVSELNQLLPNKKHIGDDIRDELVYYVIDELLAKQVKKEGFKIIDDSIKQEALDRVKNIWEFMSENDN